MVAVRAMANAFSPGGSEELQRNPQWGIPKDSAVTGFISGASNHFGFVTGCAGIPRDGRKLPASLPNDQRRGYPTWQEVVSLESTDIETSGNHGLSRQTKPTSLRAIPTGAARKTPATFEATSNAQVSFNDYGYHQQPDARGPDRRRRRHCGPNRLARWHRSGAAYADRLAASGGPADQIPRTCAIACR